MNEEIFNTELRKFLKKFGVTAQREIERAVREALEAGKLRGTETLAVRATLNVEGVLSDMRVDGAISLA